MKKQLAILLLFCYAVVLIRPAIPCISDFIAHTCWEAEHLATVHFENGKYHVHLEMQKTEKEVPVKSEPANQSETFTSEYFPAISSTQLYSPGFIKLVYFDLKLKTHAGFKSLYSPPPSDC